jgi:hypothetical protein
MKALRLSALLCSLLLAPCSLLIGQQATNVQKGGAAGTNNLTAGFDVPTGKAVAFEAGSTLSIAGTLSGTPTGGTLDLSLLTVTLPAGVGTVTSFSAGDLSPLFTTSEATATSTPALSFSLTAAAQNAVFAGPATGGTGAPLYRALVVADIPSLSSIYQPLATVLTNTTASFTTADESKLDAITGTNTGDQTITLTGDVTGAGTASIAATIQPNSVALTTDTTGDYVATVTGDTEVTVSGAGTEGRAVTLAIGTAIARDSEITAALPASRTGTHASPDTTGGAITWTAAVHVVWTNTTTEYDLPAAAGYDGRAVIFHVTGTNAIAIDPNASEVIVREGTAQTGGVTLTLAGVAGNFVCLISDGTRWVTFGKSGTLAAGS